MGQLTEYAENMRRLLELHFGVTFGTQPKPCREAPDAPDRLVVSCVGQTLVNVAKRSA